MSYPSIPLNPLIHPLVKEEVQGDGDLTENLLQGDDLDEFTRHFGYNIGLEGVTLFADYQSKISGVQSRKLLKEIGDLQNRMQKINIFLSELAKSTNESKDVRWQDDPEKMRITDELREVLEASGRPDILEKGKYSWKGNEDGELQVLKESLKNELSVNISTQIQQKMTEFTGVTQKENPILEMMSQWVKTAQELIKLIETNMRSAR